MPGACDPVGPTSYEGATAKLRLVGDNRYDKPHVACPDVHRDTALTGLSRGATGLQESAVLAQTVEGKRLHEGQPDSPALKSRQ